MDEADALKLFLMNPQKGWSAALERVTALKALWPEITNICLGGKDAGLMKLVLDLGSHLLQQYEESLPLARDLAREMALSAVLWEQLGFRVRKGLGADGVPYMVSDEAEPVVDFLHTDSETRLKNCAERIRKRMLSECESMRSEHEEG